MMHTARTIGSGIVIALLAVLPGCARWGNRDGANAAIAPASVVLIVNGKPVTRAEMDAEVEAVKQLAPPDFGEKRLEALMPRIRRDARDRLVYRKIVERAIEDRKIVATPEEIDEELRVMSEFLSAHGVSMTEVMTAEGDTTATLRESVRKQLAEDRLWDELLGFAEPGEEELKQYYNKHEEQYVQPEALRLYQIAASFPPGKIQKKERERLKGRVEKYRDRWIAGESFEKLALEALHEEKKGLWGGEIGWINREADIPPEIVETAFAQKVDEIGTIVESSLGFHLLWVRERRAARQVAYEDVRPIVKGDFQRERRRKGAVVEYRKMLRRATIVEPETSPNAKPPASSP